MSPGSGPYEFRLVAGASPKVVVDHLAGACRGERQVFEVEKKLRFGRHPDCDITFDSYKDLDASSRHAELQRLDDGEYVLRDIGSSNGTYVDGARVTSVTLERAQPLCVEFGVGGPVVRLFLGDDEEISNLPAPVLATVVGRVSGGHGAMIGILVALIVAALAAIWWRFAA